MKLPSSLCLSLCLLGLTTSAPSAVLLFDIQGKGGVGMLSTNENSTVNGTPGMGGEVGAGISYDDVTNILTINVGWGLSDGFASNLSGNATAMHIHGPTAASGVGSFTQNAGVLFGLDNLGGYSSAANGGGFNGTLAAPLTGAQELELLAGRYYLNVHTSTNSGGEIRGNIVQAVPEPTKCMLLCLGLGMLALRRRR